MPAAGSRTLYAPQRHQFVLRSLNANGRIDSAAVAAELGVTKETVRKDLIDLERQGMLRRVHGGAVPLAESDYEPDVSSRIENLAQKRRIAVAALAHLPRHGSVLIDSGSTTACLADVFPDDRELTVFTNSVPVALTLLPRRRVSVYPLGGRLRSQTVATVGTWAARQLAEINVDVAFLGTNGFTATRGFTTPDPDEAEVKRLMTTAARLRILLADHSKYGRLSRCRHALPADIDVLITDRGLAARDAKAIESAGLRVDLV